MVNYITEVTDSNFSMYLEKQGVIIEGGAEVLQSIRNLILTPKGSIPMRPDKGSDIFSFQDEPILIAAAGITASVFETIEQWEPRVAIDSLTHKINVGVIEFTLNLTLVATKESFTYNFSLDTEKVSSRAFSDDFSKSFQ